MVDKIMETSTVKQQAIKAISKLSDSAKMDEIMYRLYVLDKIRKGREDVMEGRTLSSERIKNEVEQW